MREFFLDFKEHYRQAIAKVPDDSFFRESINHKFRHSISVLHIGEKIIQETSELRDNSQDFQKLAKTALLFHDVGRFEEAVKRHNTPNLTANAEILNQYDHGLIGYETLKNNPRYNDIRILLAIRYHGKMMEEVRNSALWQEAQNSPYSDGAQKILYLVRDADKLANLNDVKKKNHLQKDIFFKLLTKEALEAGLSESVKQQFFARQTILSSTVSSFADRILQVISWIFDFNYQVSKKIFNQNEYGDYLLDILTRYHHSQDDIEQIHRFITLGAI